MPLYEFQCKKCGHRFERMLRSFSEPHPTDCPECGGKDTVHQLMSAPAVQFKGSGWYATDYANKSSAPAAKTGSKSDAKPEVKASESKSETKTETTPAVKSDNKPSTSKPDKK